MKQKRTDENNKLCKKLTFTVKLLADFENNGFSGFSDFPITCSIYSNMCNEFNISWYKFKKMGILIISLNSKQQTIVSLLE